MLEKHIKFILAQLRYTLLFVLFVAIFCLVQSWILKNSFSYFWRQFHDVVLIFTFWRITIFLCLSALFIYVYQRKTGKDIIKKISANWFLISSFIMFLFFGCLLSQLFGGCIWLWVTEHWWSRFVPSFMNDVTMNLFYIFTSTLSYIFSFKLYDLYLRYRRSLSVR